MDQSAFMYQVEAARRDGVPEAELHRLVAEEYDQAPNHAHRTIPFNIMQQDDGDKIGRMQMLTREAYLVPEMSLPDDSKTGLQVTASLYPDSADYHAKNWYRWARLAEADGVRIEPYGIVQTVGEHLDDFPPRALNRRGYVRRTGAVLWHPTGCACRSCR